MSKSEMIKWLQNLKEDIGQSQHQDLWHYAEVLDELIDAVEVSEDCINRQQAIDAVIEWYGCKPDDIEAFEEELYNAPSVIPHAKEGEWIDKGWKGDWQFETDGRGNCWHEYECPKCGFLIRGSKSSYCPHCGKRMKGAE